MSNAGRNLHSGVSALLPANLLRGLPFEAKAAIMVAMNCIESLQRVILRDLASLRDEIQGYPTDEAVWQLPNGLKNSAGTLLLHLAGNIRHYIGAQFGDTGYVRNRDAEFTERGVSRAALAAQVDEAITAARRGFAALHMGKLEQPFPAQVAGQQLPTALFLIHLAAHLAYHLGQIDYHRRLVTGDSKAVGALSLANLAKEH